MGSNSFRLQIGEFDAGQLRIIETLKEPVRLAAGLDACGNLSDEAIQKAIAALSQFKHALMQYPLEGVRAVATSAMRVSKNCSAFLPLAEQALGYPIDVISGEEEGRLIYLGVRHLLDHDDAQRLVIDIGGGSTEIIIGEGAHIHTLKSYQLGTQVQFAQYFKDGALTEQAYAAAIAMAQNHFKDAPELFDLRQCTAMIGSSGTLRAISAAIQRLQINNEAGIVRYADLLRLKDQLIAIGALNKLHFEGVKPVLIEVMISGLPILMGLMQVLKIDTIQVVSVGLRLGVLWDLYAKRPQQSGDD
jgi:exopolyphosphatase/guanosine-5'-triphosphate,3'-diphosphate pyrophosphatase